MQFSFPPRCNFCLTCCCRAAVTLRTTKKLYMIATEDGGEVRVQGKIAELCGAAPAAPPAQPPAIDTKASDSSATGTAQAAETPSSEAGTPSSARRKKKKSRWGNADAEEVATPDGDAAKAARKKARKSRWSAEGDNVAVVAGTVLILDIFKSHMPLSF